MKRTSALTPKYAILFLTCQFLLIRGLRSQNTYIPEYKGIWTNSPTRTPTRGVPDGPIAGNGDVGIVMGGTAEHQIIYLSKNDFWETRLGYPDGGVRLPGMLSLKMPELTGASCNIEQCIKDATINAHFTKGALQVDIRLWVAASKNLVFVELISKGNPLQVSANLFAQHSRDSNNDSTVENGITCVTRRFENDGLVWPSCIAMAMKTYGGENGHFTLSPGKKIVIAISMVTNHETNQYRSVAIKNCKELIRSNIGRIRTNHEQWWKRFWNKSSIQIEDKELEKYYYGSQYLLACCSRNSNFPPGLFGNSLTTDEPNWAGDYHSNYNYQAPWWGAYSSNHIELTEGYDAPILDYMQAAKNHATKFLNCSGVYYPVGLGPKGFCSAMFPLSPERMNELYGTTEFPIEGGFMFLGQKSDAVFLATNMLMRHYATYDQRYALKVYPYLKEVADFWSDYLKYENGRYMDYNDAFWEVGPWEGKHWKNDYGDINPTISLGLLRMFYKGILDMSIFLKKDTNERSKWEHILHNLSPIPRITDANGNIRIKAAEGGTGSGFRTLPGFGRVMMHGLTFPSDAAWLNTDTALPAILKKEVENWGKLPAQDANWENLGNGFETYFTSAVRLGYDPEKLLVKLKERIHKTALPNLWITQSGGGIETLSAVPSCINEMLLQSFKGLIQVFPNWPKEHNASFNQLRANGAFLVSSSLKDRNVQWIKLTSEKGRACVLENPWGNVRVTMKSNYRKALTQKGELITIQTKPGEELMITRD